MTLYYYQLEMKMQITCLSNVETYVPRRVFRKNANYFDARVPYLNTQVELINGAQTLWCESNV